ncbi:hypothetical protein [Candidatus Nitrospira bockiana]
MSTPSGRTACFIGTAVALAIIGCAGCVSIESFEQVVKESEAAKQRYRQEVQKSHALESTVKRLNDRIQELEGHLRDARENTARTEREWREARDELLRLKIEREQQARQERDRRPDRPSGTQELRTPGDAASRSARGSAEDPTRGVNEHLRRLQSLLDQF